MTIRLALTHCIAVFTLLGCSTPAPAPAPALEAAAPRYVYRIPPGVLRGADPALPPAQACYVGTKHCVDLDPRPFEPCLATDQHCPRDGKIVPLDSANMAPGILKDPYAIEPR